MDANLNLKLDAEVIRKAKEYAKKKDQSLSDLVENLLGAVVNEPRASYGDEELTPFVKSLMEWKGDPIPADLDYKKEYYEYLEKKYK